MSQTDSPWNLRGVSAEARAAAKDAAADAEVTLGVWISQLVREINAKEIAARETTGSPLGTVHQTPRLSSIERAMMRGHSFGAA